MLKIQQNSTTHKILAAFVQNKRMTTQEIKAVDNWAFGLRSGQGSMSVLEREGLITHGSMI
jgi:hypothetical protein